MFYRFYKKIIVFIIFNLLVIGNLFAQAEPLFNKNHKMCITVTEHFDIIFPEESTETALLIASRCEDFYEDITKKLNTSTYFRIPVAITPDTDSLNAFYTMEPYHRIVVYDTVPQIGMLSNFSETILSVFYHELTHAISMSIKSKPWQVASKIFGDFLAPGQIFYMPLFFLEGVTVSFESHGGEGRMNDAYSLHVLRQGKLENKFPDWRQVTGSRDLHPGKTLSYIYGGAFSAYLQSRYGMEKYAEYWHECGKINFFTVSSKIFHRVFGISIDDAWQDFYNSVDVSENVVDLREQGKEFVVTKNKTSRVENLASTKDGLAFISYSDKAVYYASGKKLEQKKFKKLFSTDTSSNNRIAFSSDGRYLAYSYLLNDDNSRNYTKIYDMKKRRFVKKIKGLRDACVIKLNDESNYGILGVRTFSQKSSLILMDFSGKEIFRKDFEINSVPFEISDCGNGFAGYIFKDSDKWMLSLLDCSNGTDYHKLLDCVPFSLTGTAFSKNYQLVLSFNDDLRKVKTTNLHRAAFVSVNFTNDIPEISIVYDDKNYLGGVFSPTIVPRSIGAEGGVEERLYFYSNFFERDYIFTCELEKNAPDVTNKIEIIDEGAVEEIEKEEGKKLIDEEIANDIKDEMENREISAYNPWKNLHKGYLLPVPITEMLSSLNVNPIARTVDLGLFYYTRDPAHLVELQTSLVYDMPHKGLKGALGLINNLGDWRMSSSMIGRYSFDNYYAFNFNFSLERSLPLFKSQRILNFANLTSWESSNWLTFDTNFLYELKYHFLGNSLNVSLQNLIYKYPGPYSTFGYALSAAFVTTWNFDYDTFNLNNFAMYPNFTAQLNLPRLLPFINPQRFTLNLPSIFTVNLLPTYKTYFGEDIFMNCMAKTVLFSYDVQDSIGKSIFYINRLAMKLRLDCNIIPNVGLIDYSNAPFESFKNFSSLHFLPVLTLENKCIMTILMGALTNVSFNIGLDINYDIVRKFSYITLGGVLDY